MDACLAHNSTLGRLSTYTCLSITHSQSYKSKMQLYYDTFTQCNVFSGALT